MRLSEAIRKGCEGTEQAFDMFYSMNQCAVCAIGAALKATGLIKTINVGDELRELQEMFPILLREVEYPNHKGVQGIMRIVISSLNGFNKNYPNNWTRERIADWVESIENSIEPNATLVTKVVEEPSLVEMSCTN